MLDSPHTPAPMLMRGNALVLKTPVENAPRTSVEKHLSWSPDIPPAARFPFNRSSPAEYQLAVVAGCVDARRCLVLAGHVAPTGSLNGMRRSEKTEVLDEGNGQKSKRSRG
jgi:hypothetical protein